MTLKEIITQPEGRRLEFKEALPENAELAKTIVAFANDAGGELYTGIRNNPREVVGLPEDVLTKTEEQVSNIIFSPCYPAILPDITFLTNEDRHIIRVTIYRGSTPPYYAKEKGKLRGTYIRVGSTNRLADEEIISELERRKRNISFDSELVMDKPVNELNIETFEQAYQEKTGEPLDIQALRKLELVKTVSGTEYPTNALVLFSDDSLRTSLFPFAKVECARFKGTTSEEFIDQKSILSNIATQAEEAYNFVLRHINKGAVVEGVYTVSRWEYPVKAIREAIRNAIVHRDYSLTGKDVKVAVYDQSDARNKIIAPVFKRMGIIDQWGNGLKLIADELKKYPQIDFRWKETGLSFQVQFMKRNYVSEEERQDLGQELRQELEQELGQELEQELGQELEQELRNPTRYSEILNKLRIAPLSRKDISEAFGEKQISGSLNRTLTKLADDKLIEHTIPDVKNHPEQKFRITKAGIVFLELLNPTFHHPSANDF